MSASDENCMFPAAVQMVEMVAKAAILSLKLMMV